MHEWTIRKRRKLPNVVTTNDHLPTVHSDIVQRYLSYNYHTKKTPHQHSHKQNKILTSSNSGPASWKQTTTSEQRSHQADRKYNVGRKGVHDRNEATES